MEGISALERRTGFEVRRVGRRRIGERFVIGRHLIGHIRAMSMAIKRLSIFLVGFLLACGGAAGRPLTPAEVAQNGTATFQAPSAKVFVAAQGALKSEGYEIAIADPVKHLIKTNRKLVRAEAYGTRYSAQAIEVTRQYVLSVSEQGGRTVVVAEPRVFMGDRDLSSESVWDLEGPMGERRLWGQLFRDMREAL
jgi:hypothetical protein